MGDRNYITLVFCGVAAIAMMTYELFESLAKSTLFGICFMAICLVAERIYEVIAWKK